MDSKRYLVVAQLIGAALARRSSGPSISDASSST